MATKKRNPSVTVGTPRIHKSKPAKPKGKLDVTVGTPRIHPKVTVGRIRTRAKPKTTRRGPRR